MSLSSLSVFFPTYNEEANIATTVEKALVVLKDLRIPKYEVIVINDGSKDSTASIVEKLAAKESHLKLINHEVNKGYGEAVKTGLYSAQYDWIFFTDSDGQFDFSEISKFIDRSDEADIIIGYRLTRQDSFIRKFNAWGWTLLANILFGLNVKDVDCAFKLIKKEVIETIPHLQSTRGGMVNPELLARAKKAKYKIIQVGVHHFPRTAGEQTGANLNVIIQSFLDLFKLWWKIR